MIPQLQTEAPVSAPEANPPLVVGNANCFSVFLRLFHSMGLSAPVGSLGKGVKYSNPLKDMWHAVVPWVGVHILHLTGDLTEVANGSGDELYDYVLIFCIAVTAALITIVWSVLDRKRDNYREMFEWTRFLMRIWVTVAMIGYGTNKLWWAQFPAPKLTSFIEPYGQTQPADLLWIFMGMSRAYSFFGGLGEMVGGLLLIVPQLATLGASITAAVMTNVLLLNLGYDVPRKIYSIHLIALCVFIMLPDLRRMLDFFVLNRKTQLTKPVSIFKDKMLNRGLTLLYVAIAASAFYGQGKYSNDSAKSTIEKVPASIRGIWTVDELTVDGINRLPMVTDTEGGAGSFWIALTNLTYSQWTARYTVTL